LSLSILPKKKKNSRQEAAHKYLTLELVVPSSKNNRFGLGGGDVSDELETFSLIRSSHFMVALLHLSHSGHLCIIYHYPASLSLSLSFSLSV
jgi:hypothetical protein